MKSERRSGVFRFLKNRKPAYGRYFSGQILYFIFIFRASRENSLAASIFMLLRRSVLRTLATFGRNCLAASTFCAFILNFIFILFLFFFFRASREKVGVGKGVK